MQWDFSKEFNKTDYEHEFYEFIGEESAQMFFPPPRRHELEVIEANLSFANNLSFIEFVHNPTAVFWFLINFIKMMEQGLIKLFQVHDENVDTLDIIINDYFQYKQTKIDKNKLILRQNLLSFQKKKLEITKRIFFDQGKQAQDRQSPKENGVQMEEEDLFADIPMKKGRVFSDEEESKRTQDTKFTCNYNT